LELFIFFFHSNVYLYRLCDFSTEARFFFPSLINFPTFLSLHSTPGTVYSPSALCTPPSFSVTRPTLPSSVTLPSLLYLFLLSFICNPGHPLCIRPRCTPLIYIFEPSLPLCAHIQPWIFISFHPPAPHRIHFTLSFLCSRDSSSSRKVYTFAILRFPSSSPATVKLSLFHLSTSSSSFTMVLRHRLSFVRTLLCLPLLTDRFPPLAEFLPRFILHK